MGTFGGHALPGTFFFGFALWWTVQIYIRYWKSVKSGREFISSNTYPAQFLCGRLKKWPIEAIAKIFFTSVGGFLEIYTAMHHGQFIVIGNAQHATMFAFFGATGIIDILIHNRAPIPQDMDYITNILALIIEGLLFHFHLHGRAPLDVLVHTILVYVIFAGVLAVILEMRYRKSLLAALGRCYFIFLQGTWFYGVGFILHSPYHDWNPMWDEFEHDSLLLAAVVFAWHAGIVFILMLILGAIIGCLYRGQKRVVLNNDVSLERLLLSDTSGQTVIHLNHDDESDFEFEKPASIQR